MKSKKFLIVILLLLFFLVAGIAIFFFIGQNPPPEADPPLAENTPKSIQNVRSPLTNLLKNPDESDSRFYAVMIDNHVFGRPYQYGLSAASVFYEALAEGEITRIMAIFEGSILSKVGPVRSVRPYFLDFAKQYNPVMIHVGGSNEALNEISKAQSVLNVDGMQYEDMGDYFKRDKNIEKPHNEYANLKEISKLAATKKFTPNFPASFFEFDTEIPENGKSAQEIAIDFSGFPQYKAKFSYDEKIKSYKRFVGGKPHIDQASKSQLTADNIVVLFTDYYPIDDVGRLKMQTVGKGDAMFVRDGMIFEGTWEREEEGILKIFDVDKKPFKLKNGVTWVEVVNDRKKVKVKS